MLGFEVLTLVPIDLNAINFAMLSIEEKQWLEDYHQKIYAKLSPHLDSHEKKWLKMRLCK